MQAGALSLGGVQEISAVTMEAGTEFQCGGWSLKFSEKMTERSAEMCYSFSSEIKCVFLFQVC